MTSLADRDDVPAADGAPPPAGRWTPRAGADERRLRRRLVAVLVLGGVLLGITWRLLAPEAAGAGNRLEQAAAVDGTLALLGLAVGVVVGVGVLLRPGPMPGGRSAAALLGSVVGALASWQVGDLVGEPPLRAPGAALVWPIVAAAVLFAGALLPGLSRRLTRADQDLTRQWFAAHPEAAAPAQAAAHGDPDGAPVQRNGSRSAP